MSCSYQYIFKAFTCGCTIQSLFETLYGIVALYVFLMFKVLIEMKVSQTDEIKTCRHKWVNLILQVWKSPEDKKIIFTKEIVGLWSQWTCQEFTKLYAIYNGTSVIHCYLWHFSCCFTFTNNFLQKIVQYCLQSHGYYI
jgi:hypothetical protein